MYPILDLTRHRQDLHWYLRSLEEVVMRALDAVSGLEVRPARARSRACAATHGRPC
jgi:lipoyl(octanoyl) transferase